MGERLTIGGFAQRSRLSPKALRLYDRQGLLVPAEVDPQSGYRYYREEQLAVARLIARLRQLDMPLAVVDTLVNGPETERPELLARWWDQVEARLAAQREVLTWLLISLSGKERSLEAYVIDERLVPAQVVLTEQRHLNADELPAWLEERTERLIDLARQHGGPAGNSFIVYHGDVSEDSDGPVEICVPIHPERVTDVAVPIRHDAAHHEAFTRITKAQMAFPRILGAFDALERWAVAHGRSRTGAPREICDPDIATAGPDDLVSDIAIPVHPA